MKVVGVTEKENEGHSRTQLYYGYLVYIPILLIAYKTRTVEIIYDTLFLQMLRCTC
jgi:hypothetical protein